MCGDGANDCGALKAAHAGISLSEAESSVASPFTSKEANITCVQNLIREGRAALVTSFGIFKYMAIYSLTQFISVLILYTIDSNLADLQFLYIDLFLISVFAFTFGHTEPSQGDLVRQPPSANLVSLPPIVSILAHMGTILGMQVLAFNYVQQQPWFVAYVPKEDVFASYENFAIFSVSAFQYIIMAIVFSQGSPYKKGFWTNKSLMVSLTVLTSLTTYIVLYPAPFLVNTLSLKVPPSFTFRLTLIGFVVSHLFIALIIERGIVNFLLSRRRSNKSSEAKKGYMKIDQELLTRDDWPPMCPSPDNYCGYNEKDHSATNPMDFSKRKVILANGNNKARTLERPSFSSANGEKVAARRHSSSICIPIPAGSSYFGQPHILEAQVSNNSSQDSVMLDNNSASATHINNQLNNANSANSDSRVQLDILPTYQS